MQRGGLTCSALDAELYRQFSAQPPTLRIKCGAQTNPTILSHRERQVQLVNLFTSETRVGTIDGEKTPHRVRLSLRLRLTCLSLWEREFEIFSGCVKIRF